jgi:hypothetical protein
MSRRRAWFRPEAYEHILKACARPAGRRERRSGLSRNKVGLGSTPAVRSGARERPESARNQAFETTPLSGKVGWQAALRRRHGQRGSCAESGHPREGDRTAAASDQ